MDDLDLTGLPDKLRDGLIEYRRLWESGLKKKANEVLRDTMKYYDTLPSDVHSLFHSVICGKICDNKAKGAFDFIRIPYEISTRLSKELAVYMKDCVLPQARWYCELFGVLDDKISLYEKNKDDLPTAELLLSALNYILEFGAHHFPDYTCLEDGDLDLALKYGQDILKRHKIDAAMQNEFNYYIKLHELFEGWDKKGDFSQLCKEHGLPFESVRAYYYN